MSKSKEFLSLLNEAGTPNIEKEKEKQKLPSKKVDPLQDVGDISDEEMLQREIDQLLLARTPNFEQVYERIIRIIEKRPLSQRADLYKAFLNTMLKGIVGPSMINRQLFNGARNFWRQLVSGVFYR